MNRYLLATILILAYLAISLPGMDAPFITTGEPREALVAQSMIIHEDLLQSVRYGDDLATKPPLFHWLIVTCSKLLGGLDEFSARLPSVLAATLATVSWTLFLVPRIGLPRALLFFLILSTAGEWFRHSSHARVDMTLACFISLALLQLFKWTQTSKYRDLFFAGIFMALSALTKGPVGPAISIMATLCSLIFWKEFSFKKFLTLCIAGAISLIPLLAWYSAEFFSGNGDFLDIFLHENLDRIFSKMSSGKDPHSHGPIYLFKVYFIGLLPWSLFALIAIPFIGKYNSWFGVDQTTKRIYQFCLITILVSLAIFIIPSSKRGAYLLPIYPATAVVLAAILNQFSEFNFKAARKLALGTLGILILSVLIVFILRLDVIDLQPYFSSSKTWRKISFYLDLFKLTRSDTSIVSWALQIIPIAVLSSIFYGLYNRSMKAFYGVGLSIAFILAYAKCTYIATASENLSPKQFIKMEIEDHQPNELALGTRRMYAEAFYIRQLKPDILVKDYTDDSKYILFWENDEGLFPTPLYKHISKEDIRKPGKHLEFAILK